jgi:hypothetical protein
MIYLSMAKSNESKVLFLLLLFLFFAICFAVLLFLYKPIPESDKWVESGPSAYRRGIDIFSPSPLYDYQVMLYLSLDHTDGSDLRFTYLNATTGTEVELPFWRVSNPEIGAVWDKSSARGNVVVRVPFISSEGTRIYARYGEGGADNSDSAATYEFFDDFTRSSLDPSMWETYWNGGLQYTVSQGILHVTGTIPANLSSADGTIMGWHSKDSFGLGTVLETRVSIDHGKAYNYNAAEIGFGFRSITPNESTAAFLECDSSGGDSQAAVVLANPSGEVASRFSPDTGFNKWRFIRKNATTHIAVIGSFLNNTYTDFNSAPMKVSIAGNCYSNSQSYIDYSVDYLLVRKWSDYEPTYIVKNEESKV